MIANRFTFERGCLFKYALGLAAVGGTAFYLYRRNATRSINGGGKVFTSLMKWYDLPIERIINESHDAKRFLFKLPREDETSGLSLASMVLAYAKFGDGSKAIRPYTPISRIDSKGYLELMVKHAPNGKMSSHLFSLKPNDVVTFKSPVSTYKWKPNSYDSVTLLGAGSGITPLFQLALHIVEDQNDKTKVNMLYGNKTPQDILPRKELDELQLKYPENFT